MESDDEALLRCLYEIAMTVDDSFARLAVVAELNPENDFVGADLRGCDMSNEDLRRFNFQGADLRGCHFYKTIFLRKHVIRAKFSTRKGFVTLDSTSNDNTNVGISDLTYTDAVATIISDLCHLSDIEEKRKYLKHAQASDSRATVQRFTTHALTTEKSLSKNSISVPYLMNAGVSLIYPLARRDIIASYVRVLGKNEHARAYLKKYYETRASGPNVTALLRDFFAEPVARTAD